MRIVILGEGKLGTALTGRLIAEKHDVVVIDPNENVLAKNEDVLDALFIKGSGVNVESLNEANIKKADVVIATTQSDETNMLSCLTAKKLGASYAIARIRDPQYLPSLSFLQKELGIDYPVNPERATAREISRMLRFPFADNIETFARGRVEMMDFKATENDPLVNIPLKDIYARNRTLPQVLICAVEHEGQCIIPKGDFIIRPGDQVHVMADVADITQFFKALGKDTGRVRNVMIMGGSRISYYLADMLLNMNIGVTIIEIDEKKARTLAEELPKASVIQGDGTDQELLLSEGMPDMDAFITLSGRDEDNLMSGLYAAQMGVKKVIVKNNHSSYGAMIGKLGLSSMVNPQTITCNSIMRTVRARDRRANSTVQRMYRLMNGGAEALEFIADAKAAYLHTPLRDLQVADDCLIGVIVRDNTVLIPFGNDTIEPGDHVMVISKEEGLSSLDQVLSKKSML